MSPPLFDQPLEMLQACHVRIEERLESLEKLAQHVAARGADGAAQSVAKEVLGYFDTSAADHHQDEDEDLFPLLRRHAAASGRPEVAAAIEELEREHATMERQWQRLRRGLAAIAKGDGALEAQEVERFAWLYRRHMERESAAVLPFAKQTLDADQLRALGDRMAARRLRA